MISLIQEKKLSHLFDVLDTSKNKLLTPDDFTLVGDRISNILGHAPNSRSRLNVHLRSFRLFIQLLADLEKEEAAISYDEWMQLFRYTLLKKPHGIKSYIHRIASYVFTLFDQDNDHVVSEKEYVDMFTVYNISEEYVKVAFQKLDENQDGVLSRQEVIDGFDDFFLSSDPDAKGNWIFGNWAMSENEKPLKAFK